MNNPSPLVPQGSLNSQGKKRLTLPVAVSMILSLHLLFLAVLLMQGCNRNKDKKADDTGLGSTDTNSTAFPAYTNNTYGATGATNTAPPLGGYTNTGAGSPITGSASPGVSPAPGATTDVKPVDTGVGLEVKEYVVTKGDTLGKIAHAHGVTLSALKKANPDVQPKSLKIGQKLKIPAGGSAGAEGASASATGSTAGAGADVSEGSTYTVKPGDTLTKIAKAHGTSAKKLRAHNKLATDKIRVGQKLKMPSGGGAAKTADTNATGTQPYSPADTNTPAYPTNALR